MGNNNSKENEDLGYIYVLYNPSFVDFQVKIGSTKNYVNRYHAYKTYHKDPSTFIKVYRIDESKINCYVIDELLKKHSNQFNIHRYTIDGGGTEHYILKNISYLENFFQTLNIKFKDITSEINTDKLKKNTTEFKIELKQFDLDEEKEYLKQINNFNFDELDINDEIEKYKKEKKIDKIEEREYQKDYINEIKNNDKCIIKAPTGAGKTYMILKAIKDINYKTILILTPRRILNNQWIKEIELHLENKYNILNISNSEDNETTTTRKIFKNFFKNNKKKIIIGCIASTKKLFEWITPETNLLIDLMIVDEAHEIKSWEEQEHHLFYLKNNNIKKRWFATATPTIVMQDKSDLFGDIIEFVTVKNLIDTEYLCKYKTILGQYKKDKKEDSPINLHKYIKDSMNDYDKKKAIVFCNTQNNCKSIHKLLQKENSIKPFLLISDMEENKDNVLKNFENCNERCVIVTCKMISYGYDHDKIDMIIFADPSQSEVHIQQALGRGLRLYKDRRDKILHVLLPVAINDDETYDRDDYKHIVFYLKFLITIGAEFNFNRNKKSPNPDPTVVVDLSQYDGMNELVGKIITELSCSRLTEREFIMTLRNNDISSPEKYNEFRDKYKDMNLPLDPKDEYSRFYWKKVLDPRSIKYYKNKKECKEAYDKAYDKLSEQYFKEYEYEGIEILENMNYSDIISTINDKKLPPVHYNYFYK
jgi:superfamily II DNA or RNA helicase